jgi:hypothetical protein
VQKLVHKQLVKLPGDFAVMVPDEDEEGSTSEKEDEKKDNETSHSDEEQKPKRQK